ncbi:hypothetical protein ACLB2K_010361 [Fragaria x ananassa]
MTTMISEWVRAGVGKSQAILMKRLLRAPNFSSRLQPRTTSHEEEWGCFNSSNNNNSMHIAENKHSSWSDLPLDILCEVADRLPYRDLVRSAALCKTWRRVIYGAHLPQLSTLLVSYLITYTCNRDGKHIEFLDMQGETYKYTVKHELLVGTNPGPYASKYGWLLLNRYGLNKEQFYLYNPFCNEVIQLPELDLEPGFYVEIATFTAPPTSPNCVIFVLCRKYQSRSQNCNISTYKLGNRRWSNYKTTCQGSVEGVTYVDGIFYCIFPEKNHLDGSSSVFISTFDIAVQKWVMDYTSIKIEDHNESRTFYLVESINGKLLLAVSDLAHDVRSHCWFLYQFDWLRKDWTMVRSLGHQVLLLSSSSSISSPTLGKDNKLSDMIFHLSWGKEPFTWSSDGVWRKALL